MEYTYQVTNLSQQMNEILFSFSLAYHPRLNEVHENNYNDNEEDTHNKTTYMCKINISKLIQEISFYSLVLIPANILMARRK
jgi:hypothetical protein